MKIKALNFSLIFLSTGLVFLLLTTKPSNASDGNTELVSTTSRTYRCYAQSMLATDNKYYVQVACRDLIYPVEEGVIYYIMWASPISDDKPIKLGELNRGRARFSTNAAFSSLFVTTEQNVKTKEPTGPVVMRGNIQKISFLESKTTPTPKEELEQEEEMVATPESTLSARDRLIRGLRRAGLVSLLALVAVFGLVFVLTRPR